MNYDEFRKRYRYDPEKDKLGEGGFGDVFRAYDTYGDVHVAIKRCMVRGKGDDKLSLKNEVEMASRLPVHANIARYEVCHRFQAGDMEFDYGVLQYYKDGSLLDVLEKGQLSRGETGSILGQILQGLHFLHGPAAGIIHRDLKPRNILMVRREGGEWVPKITDFGISKKIDTSRSQHENTLMGAGTLNYMSPEQLAGATIRPNTDLWSFGVIAFEAFTGEKPFTAGEHHSTSEFGRIELMRRIQEARLPESINNVPEPWRGIIRGCLVPDQDRRARSAGECLAVLGLDGEGNHITPRSEPSGSGGAGSSGSSSPRVAAPVAMGRSGLGPGPGLGPSASGVPIGDRTEFMPECLHCGAPVVPGSQVCPGCGSPDWYGSKGKGGQAPQVTLTCANCGKVLATGARFCPYCGSDAPIEQGSQQPQISQPPRPPQQSQPPRPPQSSQPSQPSHGAATCANCGKALAAGARFCPYCGSDAPIDQIPQQPQVGRPPRPPQQSQPPRPSRSSQPSQPSHGATTCPNCGKALAAGARFCPYCGSDAPIEQGPQQPQVSLPSQPSWPSQPSQPMAACANCGRTAAIAGRFCPYCGYDR